MKLNPNKMLAGFFGLVVIAAVSTKVGLRLNDSWTRSVIEQAQAELRLKETKATVLRVAETYAAQKTGLGAYERPGDGYLFSLPDKDAYEQKLLILYSRGAVVDSFKVRSAGPDRMYHTEDDICEEKWSANGAGAVEGVKSSASSLFQGAKDKILGR